MSYPNTMISTNVGYSSTSLQYDDNNSIHQRRYAGGASSYVDYAAQQERSIPSNNFSSGGSGYDDENKAKYGKKNLALQALNKNVYIWAGFFTVSLMIFSLLSGGDFSFLMTYGALARMFGFGILNVKIWSDTTSGRNGAENGVSIKTLQLYAIVFLFRLTSILRHEGYLPYDKSGDWLYHAIEIVSLLFTAGALFGCTMGRQPSSKNRTTTDSFGEGSGVVPPGYGAMWIAIPVLILSIFIHPNLNADFLSDAAWTYAMYLESVALIPQLSMFQKKGSGAIELLTAHFVAALGFGRLMEFIFWTRSYQELRNHAGSSLPGYLAVISQLIQLALMANFFWYYIKAVKNATPLVLPQQDGGATLV